MTLAPAAPPAGQYVVVGQRVRPANALSKCTGATRYVSDLQLPDMLWVTIVRSPHARARIVNVRADRALGLPGVEAVLTYRDVPSNLWGAVPDLDMEGTPALSDRVHFVGDAVAAVAAADLNVLQEAANRIEVEYEVLTPVLDPVEAAQPGVVQIHPYGNVLKGDAHHPTDLNARGDVEKGFAEADAVLEREYRQPQVPGVPHEPRACVAHWDGATLTIWDSTQFPFQTRAGVCSVLGLREDQVRVIATNLGGGFGMKLPPSRYVLMTALISMKTGKPAKIWFTREEETLDSHMRPGVVHRVKAGITRDGRVTAFKARTYLDNGYWGGMLDAGGGVTIARDMCRIPMELYNKIPNVHWEVFQVRTNRPRSGPYRARGCAEPLFAVECMLDELAEAVGADPCELRIRHSIRTGDMVEHLRARRHEPKPVSNVGFPECIEAGRQAIGWDRRNAVPGSQPGPVKLGIGMAGATHHAGSVPGHVANCEVVIDAQGGVLLLNGQPDLGSEQQTTLRQIVAETLALRYDEVGSLNADTALCPMDTGPIASRTAFATGTAAWRATEAAKAQVLAHAAEMLGEPESRLSVSQGKVWLEPERRPVLSLAEVAAFAGDEIKGTGYFNGADEPTFTYGFAASFVEVQVDVETGRVDVQRVVSSHDVGRAINPEIVEGQVEGGVAQGLGYALSEGMYYDSHNGAALNQWFLDLKTPTSLDTPPSVEPILIELGNQGHPLGVKGCSEISLIGIAPAVRNAVYNATGVRVDEIPITPDRVLAALAAAGRKA